MSRRESARPHGTARCVSGLHTRAQLQLVSSARTAASSQPRDHWTDWTQATEQPADAHAGLRCRYRAGGSGTGTQQEERSAVPPLHLALECTQISLVGENKHAPINQSHQPARSVGRLISMRTAGVLPCSISCSASPLAAALTPASRLRLLQAGCFFTGHGSALPAGQRIHCRVRGRAPWKMHQQQSSRKAREERKKKTRRTPAPPHASGRVEQWVSTGERGGDW